MTNAYRKLALKPASAAEMAKVLAELVETGQVSAEAVNSRINSMREETTKKAKAASEVDEANEKQLTPEQQKQLLSTVKARFEANMNRHPEVEWSKVQARLEANSEKMWSLNEMERTGGEPDVVGYDKKNNEYIFFDCSAESPVGRRNICYDREGQELAKKYGDDPAGNAGDMAAEMGIEILTPEQYKELQKLGNFDHESWSWLKTPAAKRKAGVALFGSRLDRVVDVVEFNPNVPDDYGGFRGSLRV